MTQTTVLVATPSAAHRARVAKLIASVPGYQVIATAADLSETFNCAEIGQPGIVVIAEEFTLTDEFSSLHALFDALGTRWIVLEAAAGPGDISRSRINLSMTAGQAAARLAELHATFRSDRNRPVRVSAATAAPQSAAIFDKLVVIGSSTGGIDALLTLLADYPADCPPTAIVQHTGRGFSESLVQLLQRSCKSKVVAAKDGLILRSGMVCVAGGIAGHLTLAPGAALRCHVRPGAAVSCHVPSVDVLFRSALPMAPNVVAAILTGMGRDGAAGLLDLRLAGCMTLGQDEATSVVYGMPKAARDRGAVQAQYPIQDIGPEILRAATAGPPHPARADRRVGAR